MIPISICTIAKNEEKHMTNFLTAIHTRLKNYPHEVIIVDTGSTDATVSIAKQYTEHVFYFEWVNDFSAAKNYAVSCASNDWILSLDCDEYLTGLDTSCFQTMAEAHPKSLGMITLKNHFELNDTDSIHTDKLGRFFSRKHFQFEGVVHEQVCSIHKIPFERVTMPIAADHYGYSSAYADLDKKVSRNNELLLKMLEEAPDDPYLYFQLGQSYNMIHDDEKASYYYGKGLEYDVDPKLEYVQMMVIGYGYALLHLGRLEEALHFQNIYDEFAVTADFVSLMGLIYLRNGMLVQAMAEFLKATTFENANTEGANTFIPLFNMGCINEVTGDTDTAVQYYRRCADFKPAAERLKELEGYN